MAFLDDRADLIHVAAFVRDQPKAPRSECSDGANGTWSLYIRPATQLEQLRYPAYVLHESEGGGLAVAGFGSVQEAQAADALLAEALEARREAAVG